MGKQARLGWGHSTSPNNSGTEGEAVSLLKAQLALSGLAELRAGEREAAVKLLIELARR
jgi:hypothetical protein